MSFSGSDEDDDFFGTPPLPNKRRRLSAERLATNSDHDSVSSNSLPSRSRRTVPARKSAATARLPGDTVSKAKKPKAKHLIHVPAVADHAEDRFLTQAPADNPSSSPWRLRGAIWQKPKPIVPQASPTCTGRLQQRLCDDSSLHLQAAKVPMPSLPSQAGFEIAHELADLPSDAFASSSSSPQPMPEPDHDVVLLSSQVELTPPRRTNIVAPRNGLQQKTLFGDNAGRQATNMTTTKKHNWPLAAKDEPPTHHKLDLEAMKTYVYPKNLGKRRDYQWSIVRQGLFHNLLVALPTGLGKTFIAATIMLNWLRWTVEAQIVFVAPTKPLVSQQIEACLGIAGIPRSQTSMLTGGVSPGLRKLEWDSKRIFFLTPQTLSNDLKTGIADPKRIVLVVVDEAHRATGNYAYVELVTFLRRFNQSFRILALTATPGASIEAVQEVINGLKISRIEIRTEFSIDIREYIHTKETETIVCSINDELEFVIEHFTKALQPLLQKLRSQQAFWTADPMMLSNYGLMQARKGWMLGPGRNAEAGIKGMVNRLFTVLTSIAHNIELLNYHGITPFYHNMVIFRNSQSGSKAGRYEKEILESAPFQKMMTHIAMWIKNDNFHGHPKLEHLQKVVLNHFMDAGEGGPTANGEPPSATRIMIFASYRDSAEDICRILKRNSPMIRPHVFVGQAASKGSEGMDQKQQLRVVEDFKKGIYNTLVATSIGEEGLDIGEIDLIICYDSSSSPIRMLQRIGRTGRKRAGKVCLLVMAGKEANSINKAKDGYAKMQKLIADGDEFTFHEDSARRIVPKDIKPVVDERVVDIPIENTQAGLPEPNRKGRAPKRPPKKFHMPDGVHTGFVTASRMEGEVSDSGPPVTTGKRKRAPRVSKAVDNLEPTVPLEDVLLTVSQLAELSERYQRLPGHDGLDYIIAPPNNTRHPERQRRLAPVHALKHSRATEGVIKALGLMSKVNSHRIGVLQRLSRQCDLDVMTEVSRIVDSETANVEAGTLHPAPAKKATNPTRRRKPRAGAHKTVSVEESSIAAEQPGTIGQRAKLPAASRAEQAAETMCKTPVSRSRQRVAAREDEALEAMSAESDSPAATSPAMALGTQGIDLGSDTSGEDELEGEPSSQLREFVVDDDEEIQMESDNALRSSPPATGQLLRDSAAQNTRHAHSCSDSDDEEEELPSLNTVLKKRSKTGTTTTTKRKAGANGKKEFRKRARRIVEDSSD